MTFMYKLDDEEVFISFVDKIPTNDMHNIDKYCKCLFLSKVNDVLWLNHIVFDFFRNNIEVAIFRKEIG